MNLYFRLLLNLLISRWQQRIHTGETTNTRFRVWPQDIDVFGHMNNGRYLQIMDVARTAWMSRCGALGAMIDNQWGAALGGGSIHFRKSLRVFQSYKVSTRLVCWDSRWFYLEHGFVDDQGRCIAVGISRAAIRSRTGWVRTQDIMAIVDPSAVSAPVPDYLRNMGAAEDAMLSVYLGERPSLPASNRAQSRMRSPGSMMRSNNASNEKAA